MYVKPLSVVGELVCTPAPWSRHALGGGVTCTYWRNPFQVAHQQCASILSGVRDRPVSCSLVLPPVVQTAGLGERTSPTSAAAGRRFERRPWGWVETAITVNFQQPRKQRALITNYTLLKFSVNYCRLEGACTIKVKCQVHLKQKVAVILNLRVLQFTLRPEMWVSSSSLALLGASSRNGQND